MRHPMYTGALILMVGTPLALGSFWGLIPVVPFTAGMIWRLRDEEALLAQELPGYRAYRRRIRHRLIPSVW